MKLDTEAKITQKEIRHLVEAYADHIKGIAPMLKGSMLTAYKRGVDDVIALTFKAFEDKKKEDEFVEGKLTGIL